MKGYIISALALACTLTGVYALNQVKKPADTPYTATAIDQAAPQVAQPTTYELQMNNARQAVEAGQVEVAILHYMLAAKAQPTDTSAYREAVALLRENQPSLMKADKHLTANSDLETLSNTVEETAVVVAQQNGSLVALAEIQDEVNALRKAIDADVATKANIRINNAIAHGKASITYRWTNDRHEVVAGLKELRWVYERGQFLNSDLIGDYNEALAYLNKRVSKGELDELRSQAGYVSAYNANL